MNFPCTCFIYAMGYQHDGAVPMDANGRQLLSDQNMRLLSAARDRDALLGERHDERTQDLSGRVDMRAEELAHLYVATINDHAPREAVNVLREILLSFRRETIL